MMEQGLRWVKMDLHVHTWASKSCFRWEERNEQQIAEAIVERCESEEIAAIAITDHNTGKAVDAMKQAAKRTGLVVFPGVELSCPAGKERYHHIIGIFPENWDSHKLSELVGSLKPQGDQGEETSYVDSTALQAIEEIAEHGGLAVLAHPDSTLGVAAESRGMPRQNVLGSAALSAAECSERLAETHSHIAQYAASDGGAPDQNGKHTVSGIGTRYSLFKVGEVTFEALRQCLVDHQTRIRIDTQQPVSEQHPRIEKMEITGGFLDGQEIEFHQGLNALLGGKGVGKSLIVEFLRFALDQEPAESLQAVRKDHDHKLAKRLGLGGTVRVAFTGQGGRRYRATRTYDSDTNPIVLENRDTEEKLPGSPADFAPLVVFSQREIVLTVEDRQAQMDWLLRTFRQGMDEDAVGDLKDDLQASDRDMARALISKRTVDEAREEVNTLKARVEAIRCKVDSPTVRAMDVVRKKNAIMGDVQNMHAQVGAELDAVIAAVKDRDVRDLPDEPKYQEDGDLVFAVALGRATVEYTASVLRELKGNNQSMTSMQQTIASRLAEGAKEARERYAKEMRDVDSDEAELRAELAKLQQQLATKIRGLSEHEKREANIPSLTEAREKLLDEVQRRQQKTTLARKARFDELTDESEERVRLELAEGTDRELYKTELANLKTGIQKVHLEAVANSIRPRQLIDHITDGAADAIAEASGTNPAPIEKLISHIMETTDHEALGRVLAWQYQPLVEDAPSISYCTTQGDYKPLDELSVGQKCSALTVLALTEGRVPVVIDQPEDSLDIQAVWNDVVKPLRSEKENRQFIMTTHNSTVAVAGDADVFILMSADSNHGNVASSGAIEQAPVREGVIEHLEGGRDPYRLKRRKYGGDVE